MARAGAMGVVAGTFRTRRHGNEGGLAQRGKALVAKGYGKVVGGTESGRGSVPLCSMQGGPVTELVRC